MYAEQIARVCKPESAQRFVEVISEQSYMKFQVDVCPAGGEFAVVVSTDYDAPKEEIDGMLMHLMFLEITKVS
jgi:phosphatidylethanolamine-binding protein (PEBP) family uncharacterized protein